MSFNNLNFNSCANCIYAYNISKEKYECRRFPPTALMRSDWTVVTRYPTVNLFKWCGEFKEKEV